MNPEEKPEDKDSDEKKDSSKETYKESGEKHAGMKDEKKSEEERPEGKDKSDDKKSPEDKEPKKPPIYKKRGFIITVSIIAVVLIVGGVILWLILRQFVSTDDAYIDGHVTQISPRAAAQVQALHIQDNQFVHAGDLLVELDPTDYEVALDQAQAQVLSAKARLSQAQAQIGAVKAAVLQAAAEVDAAQVQLDNATRDHKRYEEVDERARSRQQLDNAEASQKNAEAQLKQAQAKKVSADANVTSTEASVSAAEGELKTAKANQHRAEVSLSYCKIIAPVDGRVTERTVEIGNYVVVGQAMFMLTDTNVWITANFKETQMTHLRPGQPVTVKVDAYPGVKWRAHVDSVQAGSGSRFSILPAENATGNFVKVVQRIPVKIIFDEPMNTNATVLFSPGMSVIPRVKVR